MNKTDRGPTLAIRAKWQESDSDSVRGALVDWSLSQLLTRRPYDLGSKQQSRNNLLQQGQLWEKGQGGQGHTAREEGEQ